ncbi:MAG: 3-hydroxyacyl-CoA dehydrogenase [Actinomycetes bacterium]
MPDRAVAIDRGRFIGVVGAGTMGVGIAEVAAAAGHRVMLLDVDDDRVAAGLGRLVASLDRRVARGRLDATVAGGIHDRVTAAGSWACLAGAGLVVEAVVESMPEKAELFARLEELVGSDTVLATNTSSLSVDAIAAGLRRPGRLVGLHFFNPAPAMRLVEVVSGLASDPRVAEIAVATMTAWGKTPVRVRDAPGFIVNRVARPFYGEAQRLLAEGAADAATIDGLARQAGGFPMGPLELTDLVGQDVNLAVTESVWRATADDPRYAPSPVQRALVASGRLGRKTGRGVYEDASAPGSGPRPLVAATYPPRPAPARLVAHGSVDELAVLVARAPDVPLVPGTPVTVGAVAGGDPAPRRGGPGWVELPCGAAVLRTDGALATDHAQRLGRPVVLVDRCLDDATTPRLAVAASDGAPVAALDEAAGWLQSAQIAVSVVDDVAGLVLARTVAMLVNEAVDLVSRGAASSEDVETAMMLGTGYPIGPLEWGDRWGAGTVVTLLDQVGAVYRDGRHRACPRLRRAALSGARLGVR